MLSFTKSAHQAPNLLERRGPTALANRGSRSASELAWLAFSRIWRPKNKAQKLEITIARSSKYGCFRNFALMNFEQKQQHVEISAANIVISSRPTRNKFTVDSAEETWHYNASGFQPESRICQQTWGHHMAVQQLGQFRAVHRQEFKNRRLRSQCRWFAIDMRNCEAGPQMSPVFSQQTTAWST